jgi:hypothetical protein
MRSGTRGATLAEVMVVATVFFVMLAAVMMIYFSTARAQRLISVKSDIDRELMAAVRHVDAAMKSARLVLPDDFDDNPQYVETIELIPLKMEADGTPMVTAEGLPEWGDSYTISFEQGELVRENPTRRVYAKLGDNGFVRFIRPTKQMLEMDVKVEKLGTQGYKSSRETTFQFRLFNQ